MAIVDAALHEDRHHGGGPDPVLLTGHAIEPVAIGASSGQQTDVLELRFGKAEALHHQQEQVRM